LTTPEPTTAPNPTPNPVPTPDVNPGTNPVPPPTNQTPAPPVDNELVNNHQNRENIINEILTMGFNRAEIEQALVAAFYDKERAIDYLLNGIPENVLNDLSGIEMFFNVKEL